MSTKNYHVFLSFLVMLGLLFSLAQPASAMTPQVNPEQASTVTVDPEVLEELNSKGSASYWIEFSAKTDLSAADSMGWSERGWYVYNTLSQTAKESQARVAAYLSGSKVEYQSYWIKNTILVKSSNLNTLNGLLNFSEINAITPRHTFILYEPDTTAAVKDEGNGTKAIEPNLTHINADDVWATGIDGTGLVVANIDTGVRYSHQALVGQYRGNNGDGTFDHNYNWFNPDDLTDNAPRDGQGHGSHTMGTMVGDDGSSNQIGIAPGAQWMACAGCPDGGCTDTALLGCAEFIAAPTDLSGNNVDTDMRPNVVNNSWGDCGQTYDDWFEDVIAAWHTSGIYPVFSNGNASNCGYSAPPGLNTVGNPARSGNVTGVGSSGEQNGQYATHSNWGPTDNLDTVNPVTGFENLKPQVIAPGVSIRSSVPDSDTSYEDGWSGTSMSAPHVTGLVALIWQAAPCLIGDYATTETIIEESATDIIYGDGSAATPTDFPNYATGWGEIDALAAVNQASGMCAMGTLSGTVTDDADPANPVEGVTVRADDGAGFVRNVLTAADGTYTVGLPEGTYTVTATKYGYETDTSTDVEIVLDETTPLDFVIAPLGMSMVSGYVTDGGVEGLGLHGYPLYSSIHVTATGFDQTLYVDPFTGYYEIELVEETAHTFVVKAVPSGYDTLTETVTPTGAAYTHDIALMADGEACAAPGYQPDYDIFYSFESSNEGFTPGGTTSFAWGDFTSGPGEGHSGTRGIATNPAGAYNASELGWMASPVIDLSSNTGTPVIQWYDWKDIESVSWDWGRVDVTKDGGTTWTTVWGPVGGVTDTAYNQQTVALDPTYNVANFQFRFYFKSDSSVQYDGWYVDDIGLIDVPMPPPTSVFSTNFDTGNGGFTVSGTTSFAWGAPTSGPGAPYSAPNVWATNLAGNYNSSESGWITSPVIDLSGYAGLAPTISFWHWNDIESTNYDWGTVEVTKNGGASWQDVSGKIGDVSPWSQKTIALDASYAVSNFQFRFFFRSDSSMNYAGWYIDDVAVTVAEPVEIAAPCVVIPGGVVAGYVADNNTSEILVGASVVSPTVETATFELEGDPDNAGLYWVFQPTAADPEAVVFTASYAKYADDVETVSVVADAITQQDFYLEAGLLSFNPLALEHTMMMGDPAADETLTISNDGLADVDFELAEKDKGFTPPLSIPAFTGKLEADTRPASMGRAPESSAAPALSANGLFNDLLAGEPAFAVDAYPGENLIHIPDTTAPGTWTVIGAVTGTEYFAGDFTGGDFTTLYVINSTGSTLYGLDTTTAASSMIGTATPPSGQTFSGLTGTPAGEMYGLTTDCSTTNLVMVDVANGATTDLGALTGVGCGIDLAYNANDGMIYIVDIVSDSLYKVDPVALTTTLVGALGANANYAQGMDFEEDTGILYWAAYTTTGELRVIDTTTGASTLVGAFPGGAEVDSFAFATGGAADVPWLSEDPLSGTVAAEDSTEITVTFDPVTLSQPGDYMAELKVKHNTPYTYANIPVTLHLEAPETFGTLEGTVNGMEACDINPMPLEGATVDIYSQEGTLVASATTLADGSYTWALEAGTYDLEVIAAGYIEQTVEDVVLAAQATVTTNFDLRLDAPCLSVDPASLEKSLTVDTTGTQTLTLVNTGAGDATFELMEMPVVKGLNADQILLDPSFELYTDASSPWDQFSANYGSPLCNSTDCGVGGGTGPHTGSIWAWFGGSSTGDTGYVSQSVVIEPGVADISFWVEQATCGTAGASNYTALLIDGAEIWRTDGLDAACGVVGYRQVTLDMSDYADGDSHEIKFNSVTVGSGNFFVDDVELNLEAGGDVTWLSESPVSGIVPADGTLAVTITFDSTGLALGDYSAQLRVKQAPYATINVPVTLHVVGSLDRYLFLPVIWR